METMLLLLLLMMNSDETPKETLKNFLSFYRENREALSALMNVQKSEDIAEKTPEQAPAAQTESRPREEVGDTSVIEEYLKRFSV